MIRRNDPRIRQTLNQISQNLESANESAQEGFYNFSNQYLSPCFSGVKECVGACTAPCCGASDGTGRARWEGRAERNFDFYDDWDFDEGGMRGGVGAGGGSAFFGWGSGELDRLLAGSGSARSRRRNTGANAGGVDVSHQPRRQRAMSYGTRASGARRKSSVLPNDERQDPTVIPSSSFLGFLERFPWRIGARGVRYRPSAADLQENPGGIRRDDHAAEHEPLIEASDEEADESRVKHGRVRSGTQSSRETSNSLSSRGDLIPSDEEEDAVPLDDEFAMVLGRRSTGATSGDAPRDKFEFGGRSTSGTSTRATVSSKDSRSTGKGKGKRKKKHRNSASKSLRSVSSDPEVIETTEISSLVDLKNAEEQARLEEEAEIERKRVAAQKLAASRGLNKSNGDTPLSHPPPSATGTCPFPDLDESHETPDNIPSPDELEPDPTPDHTSNTDDINLAPEAPPPLQSQNPPIYLLHPPAHQQDRPLP
ncbi:hypothetical protein FQN54_006025 [Arachnomyces sp. PD_36]|nr:hypothetical protein FQN54_006025 [Arachnomyces sp. PD_36]